MFDPSPYLEEHLVDDCNLLCRWDRWLENLPPDKQVEYVIVLAVSVAIIAIGIYCIAKMWKKSRA
jgi:hypothetical protein